MCDVNIATGEVTQFEFDILLSGRIPLEDGPKLFERQSTAGDHRLRLEVEPGDDSTLRRGAGRASR